nr:HINT domain-containing protein [Streptomyces chrestomyceticus]
MRTFRDAFFASFAFSSRLASAIPDIARVPRSVLARCTVRIPSATSNSTGIIRANSLARAFDQRARTYNLTVDGIHTYYVLAGDTPILVHNSTGCPPSSKYEDITKPSREG